jgi:hypothetical protein
MAAETEVEINLSNIVLNERTYRLVDFRYDLSIEEDELALEIADPILSKLAEGFNPSNPEAGLRLSFDIPMLYNLLVRQKAHRTLLALLFRPVKGDVIDDSISLEERAKDMGKLRNIYAEEGIKRFFSFATKSRTGVSPISFEVTQEAAPEQAPKT